MYVTEQTPAEGEAGKYERLRESTENGGKDLIRMKTMVQNVESNEEGNDFEWYVKSDGEPVHVDVDEKIIEKDSTLALLLNSSEADELNKNGDTRVRDG